VGTIFAFLTYKSAGDAPSARRYRNDSADAIVKDNIV